MSTSTGTDKGNGPINWANIQRLGQDAEWIARALSPFAKRQGRAWRTCCPVSVHPDPQSGRMVIEEPASGGLRMKCLDGCPEGAIIEALKRRDLWPGDSPTRAATDTRTDAPALDQGERVAPTVKPPQQPQKPAQPDILTLALELAARGLPVFPCNAEKRPAIRKRDGGDGYQDATTDPERVRFLFAQAGKGAQLIGVPTGERSRFDVLDIDPKNGGDEWERQHLDQLPETRTHQTPSGGRHYLFRHAPDVRNRTKCPAQGADVRGEGGYICFPPSPGYEVISDAEIEPWPAWLLDLVRREAEPPRRPVITDPAKITDKRLDGLVRSLLDHISTATDGHKHDTLRDIAITVGGYAHVLHQTDNQLIGLLINALPNTVEDWNLARRTAAWGITEGRKRPLTFEERPLSPRHASPPSRDPEPAPQQIAPRDHNGETPTAELFRWRDIAWDTTVIPPRLWLAPPYLMRQQTTLMHGPGGHSKSLLQVHWAIACVLGRPFGRLDPRERLRVLLANFEDDENEQLRRLSAALEYFNATPHDIMPQLRIVTLGKHDPTMFLPNERGHLITTPAWDALVWHCQTHKPDVVFVDPLIAINAAPESDNPVMRRVMTMLHSGIAVQFDCAFALAHHDSKGGSDDTANDANNARGAGDITNMARFELAIKNMTVGQADAFGLDHEQRKHYFRAGSEDSKRNYAAPDAAEWFERISTLINGESVVRCLPWSPPDGKLVEEQATFLLTQIARGTSVGPYSPQLGKNDRSLSPTLESVGIVGDKLQRRALRDLIDRHGVQSLGFKRPGHGTHVRQGLRTATGEPYNYEWCNGEDTDAAK